MRQLIGLLLLLPLLLVHTTARRFGKCCPPGDVLALDAGNFTCTPKRRQELVDPRQDAPTGLPSCGDSGYLVQRLLEDNESIPRTDACVDVFLDDTTRQDFPVAVHCESLTYLGNSSQLQPPRIANLRKCCPRRSAYDADRKFCVPAAAAEAEVDDFTLVFSRLHAAATDFLAVFTGPPTCEHALVDYKVDAADVYADGAGGLSIAILWNGLVQNVSITPSNGCLDISSPSSITARVCSGADYCLANPCIRKCCRENEVNIKCQESPSNVTLENFRAAVTAAADNSSAKPAFDVRRYGLLFGIPCTTYYAGDPSEQWEIGSLGEFLIPDYPSFNYVNSCIEFWYGDDEQENGIHPVYCFDDDQHYESTPRFEITGGLAFLSCFFLLTTLLVYICLPALQNLHGKTLMCHVLSLFFAYLSLGMINVTTHTVLDDAEDGVTADYVCKYMGFLMMLSFHSAFFWLNVMCFDIWWTFGGMQGPASAANKRRQQRTRFLLYCGYAWGLALLLTCLAAIFEHTGLVQSSMGRERCWFENHSNGELIFFMLPISLTLLINVGFFAVTSYRCSKVKAEIKRAMASVKDPTARKFHSDRTRLIMNLKLFVVMGMPWLLENIPSLLSHYNQMPTWLQEALYAADVVNTLQGLWIFILFVLKPKVYHALRKRYTAMKPQKSKDSGNTLNVLHPVRKSASNTTITSNFMLSSTTT